MGRNKLYILVIAACLAGYIWLFLNDRSVTTSHLIAGCLIKQLSNIPCPSCGVTRSVLALLNGNLVDAFYWNPLGILLAMMMTLIPLWIIYDYLSRSNSFFNFYQKTERLLQRKKVALPFILLLIINWIWNIYKGL